MLTLAALHLQVALSGNILSLKRTNPLAIELRLQNSDTIAALQLTLQVSNGTIRSQPSKGERIADEGWVLASHQPEKSVINIVLYSLARRSLHPGSGPLVLLFLNEFLPEGSDSVRVQISSVVASDSAALQVFVETEDLAWSIGEPDAALLSVDHAQLGQNYPNPFNPSTTIPYILAEPSRVRLEVYDLAGRLTRTLVSEILPAGSYTATWRGDDAARRDVASGLYVVRLRCGNQQVSRKVLLTR